MKDLVCAIVGNGRPFSVRIEGSLRAGNLVNKLKEDYPSIIQCEARDVALYLAKKRENNWLKTSDPDARMLAQGQFPAGILAILQKAGNKMDVTYRISNEAFNFPDQDDEDNEDGVIHVLVVVPGLELRDAKPEPSPLRKRRWDQLNEYFDRLQRTKRAVEEDSKLPFEAIEKALRVSRYAPPQRSIPDGTFDVLNDYLARVPKAFGGIHSGEESKRLHCIVPFLVCVRSLLDGDARLECKQEVVGKSVHGDAVFDFILQRGNAHVCVMQATRGDFQQGLARSYVGVEALAEAKELTKVFAIVANFVEWFFVTRSSEAKRSR